MAETPAPLLRDPTGHQYAGMTALNSNVHQGDVHNYVFQKSEHQEPDLEIHHGLCLASAPVIDSGYFIGRAAELAEMSRFLHPSEKAMEQVRLILGGVGGIGKTQLAIAYARLYQANYTSIFWLNVMTELTLKESFQSIGSQLLTAEQLEGLNGEQIILRVQMWLSDRRNRHWLLVLDNYDDPDEFAIHDHLPRTAHGSIIITTRLPELVTGQHIRLSPIGDLNESLEILQTRSQRERVGEDPSAHRLAQRLEGLPLALATAGAYLRKTIMTFDQYLQSYEQCFNINPQRPVQLREYRDRTLYTTWDLSYHRLERDDSLAAKLLKLLAYFDNQEIRFELFHAGLTEDSPEWLREIFTDCMTFNNVMGTLVEYCLIEAHPIQGFYSMHNCIHDWTLSQLNRNVSEQLYWYAVRCVASNIRSIEYEFLGQLCYASFARHGLRCTHAHFRSIWVNDQSFCTNMKQMLWIAQLLAQQAQGFLAEQMYLQVLAASERTIGFDHEFIVDTVVSLGCELLRQGKLEEAEQMFLRGLAGGERVFGPGHPSILETVSNLGIIYREQDKLDEAERMQKRVLAGRERVFEPDHSDILDTVTNLGIIYHDQRKLDEAERMYKRALSGRERVSGPDHLSTLHLINCIGTMYHDRGKLDEAEQMYLRALAGREKALGSDHIDLLDTVSNLATLYVDQGKLDDGEILFKRVLSERQRVLGPDHWTTLKTITELGRLYRKKGQLDEAEVKLKQALAGYKKVLGEGHRRTKDAALRLSNCYRMQGKLEAAEEVSSQIADREN